MTQERIKVIGGCEKCGFYLGVRVSTGYIIHVDDNGQYIYVSHRPKLKG